MAKSIIYRSKDGKYESRIYRDQKGIYEDVPHDKNYNIIRSMTMDENGKIDDNKFISEIFTGFSSTNKEYIGYASTLLLPGHKVVMASQIYEKSFVSGNFEGITTYKDYFRERQKYEMSRITWLGAPSIVFSYKNRKTLTPFLNGSPIINIMFWITSFTSADCFKEFTSERESTRKTISASRDKVTLYCDRYEDIKAKCREYQKFNTYKSYYENLKIPEKKNKVLQEPFFTTIDSAITRIEEEEKYLNDFNKDNSTTFYQRYNEILSYIYPWDIEGIEIGNLDESELLRIIKLLENGRAKTLTELEDNFKDPKIISKINLIITIMLHNANYVVQIKKEILRNKINSTLFLLTKMLILSECNLITKSEVKDFEIDESEKPKILDLINNIKIMMEKPLDLYEYRKDIPHGGGFTLKKTGQYTLDTTTIDRKSPFVLFEQNQDETTKLGHIVESKIQLQRTPIETLTPQRAKSIGGKNSINGSTYTKYSIKKKRIDKKRINKRTRRKNYRKYKL